MLNLIVNAVEAMSTSCNEPHNSRLSTGRDASDGLLIIVQDSSPGVDSADLVRVFATFYSTKSMGSGIGLSICRAIVESHSGKLWVSTGVPRGAIFQVTLPVCAEGVF
jgi:signal transduction histidine kinase